MGRLYLCSVCGEEAYPPARNPRPEVEWYGRRHLAELMMEPDMEESVLEDYWMGSRPIVCEECNRREVPTAVVL